MKVLGIIPARYGSTRFEGKILADLCGKPVVQHTWERAKKSRLLDELIIATDDKRIYDVARGFGAKAVLTSLAHKTGTDRLKEVVQSIEVDIIVNIQGDEPLISPLMIDDVVFPLLRDKTIVMATLCNRIKDLEDLNDPNVVKVVFDKNGFALYFSRSPIPYCKNLVSSELEARSQFYKHIGIYAYTKDFLFTITSLPQSKFEKLERLEQLRPIENGYKIKVIETKFDTIGIDTPEDLEKAKARLGIRNGG